MIIVRNRLKIVCGFAVGCAAVTAAFLGCSWGLGELRGADAQIRRDSAVASIETLMVVKEIAVNEDKPAIVELVDNVLVRLADQAERARIAGTDHGYLPTCPINPDSLEADNQFNEYAGMAYARDVHRRKVSPAAVTRAVATAVSSMLPWWVNWLIRGAAVYVLVSGLLVVRAWRKAYILKVNVAKKDRAIDQWFEGAERALAGRTREEKEALFTGEELKHEHFVRNLKRKTQLEMLVGQAFPDLVEQRGDTMNMLGADIRRRLEIEDAERGRHQDATCATRVAAEAAGGAKDVATEARLQKDSADARLPGGTAEAKERLGG